MQWGLFNYFPAAHYDIRIQELENQLEDSDLQTDGGEPVDSLGRTLEEQLIDSIIYNFWIDQDKHRIHEEYVSDTSCLDGDVPFGTHVVHENGGPKFKIEEPYLAPWHRDKAVELLQDSYEALLEHCTASHEVLPDGGEEKESDPTAYALFYDLGDGKPKQPVIEDFGTGVPHYLFNTLDDLERFTKEYAIRYGVTDLDRYDVVELEMKQRGDAEQLLGFSTEEITGEIEENELNELSADDYTKTSRQKGLTDY